jgi:hypothetical protein
VSELSAKDEQQSTAVHSTPGQRCANLFQRPSIVDQLLKTSSKEAKEEETAL